MNYNLLDDILNNKYGKFVKSKTLNTDNCLSFSFILSMNCNYNCSYCLNKNNILEKKMLKELNKKINLRNKFNKNYKPFLFKNVNNLKLLIKNLNKITDKQIRFTLLGGEPTLCINLDYVIDILIEYEKILILSNGSKPINYFENFLKKYGNKIDYVISFHPEFANIEHFIDLEKLFLNYNYNNYNIKILLCDYYYEKIIELYDKLENKKNVELTLLNNEDKVSDKLNFILNNNVKNTHFYEYELYFENNKKILLDERDMVYLGNRGLFNNTKCVINKEFYTITNNISIVEHCSNKIFNIFKFNDFFDYYNKDYILCNNNVCNLDCRLRANKYV